jgi:hypothetical protein
MENVMLCLAPSIAFHDDTGFLFKNILSSCRFYTLFNPTHYAYSHWAWLVDYDELELDLDLKSDLKLDDI